MGYREYVACGNDQEKNRTDLRHLTHPLSGERHRHGISPAQGRFILNITYIGKDSKHIFQKDLPDEVFDFVGQVFVRKKRSVICRRVDGDGVSACERMEYADADAVLLRRIIGELLDRPR